MTRRSLALLLLCAQGVALAHLALTPHVAGERGEVVDAQPVCPQPEHGPGIAHGHALEAAEVECEVFAVARTPIEEQPSGPSRTTPCTSVAVSCSSVPLLPLDVLTVAPKGSPPG